jgi:multiple sugar transport system permease protein
MGARQRRASAAGGVPSQPTGDSRKRRDWTPTILLAPAIAYMTVVGFYPRVYSIYISLTNYKPAQGQQGDFIGLDNYVAALSDGLLWHSLLLTALFTVLSVGISLCLAILLALLFN